MGFFSSIGKVAAALPTGGVSLIPGIGDTFGVGASGDAKNAAAKASSVFSNIDLPSIKDLQIKLKGMVQQGTITPEQAETIYQQQSGLNDYQADPQATQAKVSALQGMQDTVDSGGLDAQAKANLNQERTDENTAQKGSRDAILSNARARGVAGSGLELGSALENEQASAGRSSQAGFDQVALQEQRRREALSDLATTGTSVENQKFGEANTISSAQDAINRFNAANQQAQVNKNVDAVNSAQEKNLAEKQRIADANVTETNAQTVANANANQQNYENKLKKAQGQAAGYGVQANVANSQSQILPNIIGAGVGAAGAAAKGG